jgi:hypothetical protein
MRKFRPGKKKDLVLKAAIVNTYAEQISALESIMPMTSEHRNSVKSISYIDVSVPYS